MSTTKCIVIIWTFFSEIKISSIRQLARLRDSEQLQRIMHEIDNYSNKDRKASDIIGPVETDPEYQLIVEANNLAVEVDNEIGEP